jgi:hypothetical protein
MTFVDPGRLWRIGGWVIGTESVWVPDCMAYGGVEAPASTSSITGARGRLHW